MPQYLKTWFFVGLVFVLITLLFLPKKQEAAPKSQAAQISQAAQSQKSLPNVPLSVKLQTYTNVVCQQGCALKWCKRAKCGDKGDKSCKSGHCRGCWKQPKRVESAM